MEIIAEKEYLKIGTVQFRDSSRAKVVNITVKPFQPVFVSIPAGMDFNSAKKSFENNMSWVVREKEKMSRIEREFTIFDFGDTYDVKDRPIRIVKTDLPNTVVRLENATDIMIYEKANPTDNREVQAFIQEIIIEEMRIWCKKYIPHRIKIISEENHIHVGKVIIRNSATRWGSLGKHNNLNLSLYMAKLPDHLIDYVILHELAHIRVKDHSKRYWDYLATLIHQPKKFEAELKNHRIGVI